MAPVHGDDPLSHSAGTTAISAHSPTFWESVDAEFRSILSSTSTRLASGEINTSEAGEIFVSLCKAHLERYGILKVKTGDYTSY